MRKASFTNKGKQPELAQPKSKRRPEPSAAPQTSLLVLTVGHSTRAIGQFLTLLRVHGVRKIADVRTIPRSRHNPQFNADSLAKSLAGSGLGYVHFAGLGGLRHARSDSPNTGWRNASFRGFADYMQTSDFEAALEKLITLASRDRLALMCAEAVPWRCHRSLIADALLVRGIRVEHILSASGRKPHMLTPFAKIRDTHISYPQPAIQTLQPKAAAGSGPGSKRGRCRTFPIVT